METIFREQGRQDTKFYVILAKMLTEITRYFLFVNLWAQWLSTRTISTKVSNSFQLNFSLLHSERKTKYATLKPLKTGVNTNSTMSIFSVDSDENLNGLQKVYAWYQSNRNTLHTKPVRRCNTVITLSICSEVE